MNKNLGYWVLRQILFTSSAALHQQHLARIKRNVIVSAKSKQIRHFRPTICATTLGISEYFDAMLSRKAHSFRTISVVRMNVSRVNLIKYRYSVPFPIFSVIGPRFLGIQRHGQPRN